jgi:carbon starvation protein
MNAATLGGIALFLLWLGYRFYGTRIETLFGVDPNRKTPAETEYDGVDFVPASHWFVLVGHHFSSIAGAAPIIGPVIAVSIWGWGPSLIWIVLGCVLMGAVHDFGALICSVKNKGRSIADIGGQVIGNRPRVLFSIFIWLTLILLVAVFIFFSAKTYVAEPKVVLPSLSLIPIAVLIGFMIYRLKMNQLFTSVVGIGLMVGAIALGEKVPIDLGENGLVIWSIVLIAYSFTASVIPVQVLLQPRDYLCGLLLVGGVLAGYAGLFITRPTIEMPAFVSGSGDEGLLWPMLFVTIACGAISGFHSLVASGTTSKQLANEGHAKRIGFGAMIVEGAVAVMALMAILTGFQDQSTLTAMLAAGGPGPIGAFSMGYKTMTAPIFGAFGGVIAITILNAFILSTLDTGTRIGRYITHELFGIKNRYLATLILVVPAGALALSGKWKQLWPIFGAANQLVASLTLLVLTSWLIIQKKPILYTLIPALLVLVTTMGALVFNAFKFYGTGDYLLLSISVVLMALAVLVFFEAFGVFTRSRSRSRSRSQS